MRSEEAGGREEDPLVSLWNKDANFSPASPLPWLWVWGTLGLLLHEEELSVSSWSGEDPCWDNKGLFLSVNKDLKLKIFHYFLVRSSGEVSIGYDEARGLREGLLCPAMSLESMGKRRTS